jgi:hypothetical protein
VELDFSRKGSTAPRSGSFSTAGNLLAPGNSSVGGATPVTPGLLTAASARTIAASLTCCRHCGLAYLDNYVGLLTCRASPPTVDFRGQLASRHSAIVGWSLTSYLKTLHSGGVHLRCRAWWVVYDNVTVRALQSGVGRLRRSHSTSRRSVSRE